MRETLYTIPVNDAFSQDSECPLCAMKHTLEKEAVEYTLGASYMEDDVRAETDRTGFCEKHLSQMYHHQNRLGLALILKTHMEYTIKKLESMSLSDNRVIKANLFKKKQNPSEFSDYINNFSHSCFICNKIEHTMNRYIATIFHLYKKDSDFIDLFHSSKGFCINHFGALYHEAGTHLTGELQNKFLSQISNLCLSNLDRVKEDLDWFIDKFDYRYADEPWKNSKDALPRSILKIKSLHIEE